MFSVCNADAQYRWFRRPSDVVDPFSIVGPFGEGHGTCIERRPATGGEIQKLQALGIKRHGDDGVPVGRPAGNQQTVGAGNGDSVTCCEIEDAQVGFRARSDIRGCGENYVLPIGRPARIRFRSAITRKHSVRLPSAVGSDNEDGAGFVGGAVHKGELGAVGRPADRLRVDRRIRQLRRVAAVLVGSPENTVRVGNVCHCVGSL